MLVEAPVLGCQNGVDDMLGQFFDGQRIALDDAALADFVAVAVEEGDGVFALALPVAGGLFEGGQGKRKHEHCARSTQRHAFAGQLEEGAAEAGKAEPAEEDRDGFPDLGQLETGVIKGRIEPGVDFEQTRGARAL